MMQTRKFWNDKIVILIWRTLWILEANNSLKFAVDDTGLLHQHKVL